MQHVRPIHLEVEHGTNGERRACEFVQVLAGRAARARGQQRAKAIVLKWPTVGGLELFCLASGWDIPGTRWRLTAKARERARKLAADEGLALPEPSGLPPPVLRARAREAERERERAAAVALDAHRVEVFVHPRQVGLFGGERGND